MWRIIFIYILFKRFYFGDKISLNHVADFLQLHFLQKVLFWWQDLSPSCGWFSTTTSSSKGSILVTRYLSIMWRIFYSYMWWIFFSYILFKRFYFGDKISLNHVADFLQLHPLQKVLFWWQDLSQSSGRFSSATSFSKGSNLVTRYLSIMWRIFFTYILFKRFYVGDMISLNHLADFLQLYLL